MTEYKMICDEFSKAYYKYKEENPDKDTSDFIVYALFSDDEELSEYLSVLLEYYRVNPEQVAIGEQPKPFGV